LKAYDPEVLKHIIMAHPLLLLNRSIYRNIYYIPPQVFGGQKSVKREIQHWLQNMKQEYENQERIKFLAKVLDRAEEALIIFRDDGQLLAFNSAFARLTGYCEEELQGMNGIEDITPPEWHRHEGERLADLKKTGKPQRYEKEYRRRNGSRVPVEIIVYRVPGSKAEEQYCYAFVSDISRRRKGEEALRESRYPPSALLDSLPGMAYRSAADRERTMAYVSEGCFPLTGYQPADLIANGETSYGNLIHPEDRERVWSEIRAALSDLMPFRIEYRIVSRDGAEKWVWDQGRGIAVSPRDSGGLEGFITDITERKARERELEKDRDHLEKLVREQTNELKLAGEQLQTEMAVRQQMEQEMLRLDRLNLVGEMAAGIGHEIRNPMTTIRGFLQMLGRKETYQEDAESFKIMIEELDRANLIISEFLSLAKNKPVNLKTQSLNAVVKSIFPLIQADALLANKSIVTDLGDIPDIPLDEKGVRQMLLNLARNGLEAMEHGKKLTIATFRDGEEIVLAVRDEGGGIEPQVREKIGTPFVTTKEQGTGLGLAISYNIAAGHGATIKVDTGPGGTTFFIRFKGDEKTH
jgi:PAS domain S-box-containing protein